MQKMIAYKNLQTQRESQFQMMRSDMWEALSRGKKHLVILPWSTVKGRFDDVVSYEVGNFAVNRGMTINFFPLARTDMEAIEVNDAAYREALISGADCGDFMYILDTKENGQELGLEVYEVDGFYVGIME